jgi:hypothetical protein
MARAGGARPLVCRSLVAEFGVRVKYRRRWTIDRRVLLRGQSDEVRDRFAAAGFTGWELTRWFTREARSSPTNPSMPGLNRRAPGGHWFLDMWTAARDQLRSAGVREDRIFVADLCTASHPEAFCSYRRDRSRGRMAAAIRKGGSTNERSRLPLAFQLPVHVRVHGRVGQPPGGQLSARRRARTSHDRWHATTGAFACSGCRPGCLP